MDLCSVLPVSEMGQVEIAELRKPKYGNGSTEVRRKPPVSV